MFWNKNTIWKLLKHNFCGAPAQNHKKCWFMFFVNLIVVWSPDNFQHPETFNSYNSLAIDSQNTKPLLYFSFGAHQFLLNKMTHAFHVSQIDCDDALYLNFTCNCYDAIFLLLYMLVCYFFFS